LDVRGLIIAVLAFREEQAPFHLRWIADGRSWIYSSSAGQETQVLAWGGA